MAQYRKKPVVIEAVQLPTDRMVLRVTVAELFWFFDSAQQAWMTTEDGGVEIETLEGTMKASPGDWIIKGIQGEFYPCKPDIFAATYEPVA